MTESIVNKRLQHFRGVNPSSNATLRERMNAFFTKLSAFTLAETLVVMGIIGVVAALTIPNLNQSTGDREKVAKVKKVYANLEDALGRATAVYGPVEDWTNGIAIDDLDTRLTDRISEFMKVSKKISYNEFNLADGTYVNIYLWGTFGKQSNHYENAKYYSSIRVDIDGSNKGKNEYSHDIFDFAITDQGVLPDSTEYYIGSDEPCSNDGMYYCTAWVILNGNMDYLKCYDDLSWNGKTSCK